MRTYFLTLESDGMNSKNKIRGAHAKVIGETHSDCSKLHWWAVVQRNGSRSTRPTYQLGPFQLGPVPEPTRPIRNSDFWPTRFPSCVSYFRDRLYLKNNLFTVWVITTHNIDGISMPKALCFKLTMQFTVIAREQWMMTHQHEWLIRWLRKFNSVLRLTKNSQIWPRFRDRPPAHPW